ncbi:MAG TPA: PEP-utilizing enzyme [Gemmatimonadaceae bacterium]|nr:PEP-utilizing enzyme [Gemmatimonadaceae bacterium]
MRDEAGSTKYALRASPTVKAEGLSVLRNRNLPIKGLLTWISQSGINFDDYEYSFERHVDSDVAAIFVVTDLRILGEAIEGGLLQLNRGLHNSDDAVRFEYDFNGWRFSRTSATAPRFLQHAIACLRVPDRTRQVAVEREMGLGFSHDHLKGYFEAVNVVGSGVIFIDYNRQLLRTADLLGAGSAFLEGSAGEGAIVGHSGCVGIARGVARVVAEHEVAQTTLAPTEVLVCRFTSPDFLPLIIQAAAVVTDVGGVLSHAAIVCRELAKPCVIGTRVATVTIHDGDDVEVDGTSGVVRFLTAK